MGCNIEIKARARDFEGQQHKVKELTGSDGHHLSQCDPFFSVPHGRLKLREFSDGTGELIYYERDNTQGPRASHYSISKTMNPTSLKEIISQVLPISGQVIKDRWLYLDGPTRIHFDRVKGLGKFIELEVVLDPSQHTIRDGEQIAARWMEKLQISTEDLSGEAYIDLLSLTGP